MKKCRNCHREKEAKDFEFQRAICKQCRSQQQKLYRETHQEKIKLLWENWQGKNKKKRKSDWKCWYDKNKEVYQQKRRDEARKRMKRQPWLKTLSNIKRRLAPKALRREKNKNYRKIKNFLTKEDLRFLWFRDKAYSMKQPSIHRKEKLKHYTRENCEYLELKKHLQLHWREPKC